ncbi:MAG: DUF1684 domain-containing protein [bacterium]
MLSEGDNGNIVYRIQKHRLEKDQTFRNSPNSPLLEEHKRNFIGLPYFPIDLKYRFEVRLQKNKQMESINIVTSAGTKRQALKYGYFEFTMEGKKCKLNVYKLLDIKDKFPNYLFIPFMDATSGRESYPGGRYLDLDENDSGTYILDFNMSYNPLCTYGKSGYVCPIPPAENKLDVPVRAGEKMFLDGTH